MVTGRTAHGISRALTGHHGIGGAEGGLSRPVGCLPGVGADGTAAVGHVAAGLGENTVHVVGGADVDVGHHLIAPVVQLHPAPVGGLQEAQVAKIMDTGNRTGAVVGGLQYRHVHRLQTFQHLPGTVRYFLGLTHLAPREEGLRDVQVLSRVEVCFHCPASFVFPWEF